MLKIILLNLVFSFSSFGDSNDLEFTYSTPYKSPIYGKQYKGCHISISEIYYVEGTVNGPGQRYVCAGDLGNSEIRVSGLKNSAVNLAKKSSFCFEGEDASDLINTLTAYSNYMGETQYSFTLKERKNKYSYIEVSGPSGSFILRVLMNLQAQDEKKKKCSKEYKYKKVN